jgi:predicted glycoside hydrolase/deacetylase ChbG (UPF0249 family)
MTIKSSPAPAAADGTRRIVLCADDYGLSPGVGQAIRELIAAGRLSATGCMAASPDWPAEARLLKPLDGRADIGLHFSLTGLPPLTRLPHLAPGAPPAGLARIVALALAGRLDEGAIAAELEAQLDAFETAFGRPPDFIDGHQHVHQLPTVRAAVLAVLARRLGPARLYVRNCLDTNVARFGRGLAVSRAIVIGLLGAGFGRALKAAGIAANPVFRGVRSFEPHEDYPAMFRAWISDAPDGTLIMCHPGHPDATLAARDPVTDAREAEFSYFASDVMPRDLEAARVRLERGAFLYTSGTPS